MLQISGCDRRSGLIQTWKIIVSTAFISMLIAFCAPVVQAAERTVENPPLLPIHESVAGDIKKAFDLNVEYTCTEIYNPSTQRYDKVKLRSYAKPDNNCQQPKVDVKTASDTPHVFPYVAPTIEVNPGDTLQINFKNKLPANDYSCEEVTDINKPHCLNNTNFHTHGLWVSPEGNSDNVLLSIPPNFSHRDDSFQYEFNIPRDHPAGTFWYHPHLHGSTALQVSSGMGGALIIRGDRLPTDTQNGDIDILLKDENGNSFPERILVLQQIQYACLDKDGKIKKRLKDGKVVEWVCDQKDTGIIESYDGLGANDWKESGRYTAINGLTLPTFVAEPGKIERWRMIHAGVRNTISLEFRKLVRTPGASGIGTLKTGDFKDYIVKNCTGEPIPYHIIANDGLTRSQVRETTLTTLQPGYRIDALVVFPEQGSYCVIDASTSASGSASELPEGRQLLGVVNNGVENSNVDDENATKIEIHNYVKSALIRAAEGIQIEEVKQRVINDLNDNLKLSAFIPHPDIKDSDVTGFQYLTFRIDTTKRPPSFQVGNSLNIEQFPPEPYDRHRTDRKLNLNDVDEWTLESYTGGHPFHIHVNPFQIVKILDLQGKDVSLPNAEDNGDPEYQGLSGVWKDTIWVKNNSQPYTIVVRTRYDRYVGKFVLHCHILDHEDQGMMQNVDIVIPDRRSVNTASHS